MPSKNYLSMFLSNPLNWAPALHRDVKIDRDYMRHTCEMALANNQNGIDITIGYLQELAEEFAPQHSYQWYVYTQQEQGKRHETTYLVVSSSEGGFVNSLIRVNQPKTEDTFFSIKKGYSYVGTCYPIRTETGDIVNYAREEYPEYRQIVYLLDDDGISREGPPLSAIRKSADDLMARTK